MSSFPARDVTQLLNAWSAGDAAAFEDLVPLVEAELRPRTRDRKMAKVWLRRELRGDKARNSGDGS